MNLAGRCDLYREGSGEPLGAHMCHLIVERDRRVWGHIEVDGGDDPNETFDQWFAIARIVVMMHTPRQGPAVPGGEPVVMWSRGACFAPMWSGAVV